jgi:hypothetical protein
MQNLHIDGLKLTVPYLYKPHNRHCYHYRRTVPKDLQAHYPQKVLLKSLATANKLTLLWPAYHSIPSWRRNLHA